MSDLFDKLAEGAKGLISEVDKGGQIQGAVTGLRQRLAEADRKRKVAQVKQQIGELRDQETQAINSLSAQVLALHEAGRLTQPELVSLCRRVDELRVLIKEQEAELQKLQPPSPPAPAAAPAPTAPAADATCPKCGSAVVAGAAFCQACGTRLAPEPAPAQFCIHCGAQLRENARFCPKCGKTVTPG